MYELRGGLLAVLHSGGGQILSIYINLRWSVYAYVYTFYLHTYVYICLYIYTYDYTFTCLHKGLHLQPWPHMYRKLLKDRILFEPC